MEGMNFIQLLQGSNLIRAPPTAKFQIDGEAKVQKALYHSASLQLWNVIQSFTTTVPKNILSQKIAQLYRYLVEVSVCEVEKPACAKIVAHGQTIAECFECRMDESCIICMQCFKNGNHKGHRVVFKKAGGGCCDCGDTEAWKEEGFCSKHSGKEKEIMIDQDLLRKTNQMLFELYYLYTILKLSNNRAYKQFFTGFFDLLTKMVRKGLKGMKLVATFFISDLPKKLTACSKLTGKILEQLMVIDFTGSDFKQWQNLFIEMFPVYTFKQQLLSSYVRCYHSIYSGLSKSGLSISCQIMTSYKLVEDYVDSFGAVPIVINTANQTIDQVLHLTRMFLNDLYRINSLQGNAPLKYWKMQLRYGVQNLFGYYEVLKDLAQKQKYQAAGLTQKQQQKNKLKKDKQSKINKQKKKKNNAKLQIESEDEESFSILDFVKRHVRFIELEHTIIQQFLQILPVIAKQEQLMNRLIKDLITLISKQLSFYDDLLIFRPYDRMLAVVFYYLSNQTPYLLTSPTIRSRVLMASGMSEERLSWFLSKVQSRMTQTLTFYTYIQTHQNQNYHHIFYVFIVVYCSAYYLLGYVDILAIKEMMLLGTKQIVMDFESLAKFQFYEVKQRKWNLKMVSNLFTELGLIYIGHFSEIYISHHRQNVQVPKYILEQSKLMLRKFITSNGGSANFEKVTQFSNNFITSNEDIVKTYLKTICTFNKTRKIFELLPNLQDKNPINFKDFGLRAKTLNQHAENLPPASTLQLIDRENNIILASLWNKKNVESLCSILLQIIDQVLNKKSKDELIAFYSIPCRLSVFLKHANVPNENYAPLTEMLQNLDVTTEVRKWLGTLASELSPLVQNNQMGGQQEVADKQLQKQKKLKKLEELKKKKNLNLQKIKEIHELSPTKIQSSAQECAICRKTGGSLVWISRLGIKNLENICELGEGALTFSFTSCYHVFHYECVSQASIKRSNHQVLFRCPVCRTLGNVLINMNPAQQSQVYVDAVSDRILQVAMTLRNYEEINITQQLIKSFYHYVLLGYAQPQYVKQKRLKLYKKIIELVINMKVDIDEVERNLQQKKIMLVPKMALQEKQKIDLKEVDIREIQYQQEDYSSDEELQIWMIDRNRNMKQQKQKMEDEKNKKSKPIRNKKETSQYSKVFYYTLKRIITHIKAKRQQKSKKKEQQQAMINQNEPEKETHKEQVQVQNLKKQQIDTKQVPEWAMFLLDQLLDKKQRIDCEWNPPKLVKINLLPEKYYWDMTQNTCDYCNIICNEFLLCLLCDWKGCLNSCKRGGIKKHNKNIHGENGAFLRLKDATVYLMSPGEIKRAGCLYVNEWGEDFKIKDDWSKYYLQTSVIDQAVSLLIKDE